MKTFSYQVIQAAQDHATLVSGEGAYYKTVCKHSAIMTLKSVFTDASGHSLYHLLFIVPPPGSCIPGLQHDITVHCSFDFAQHVMTNCPLNCAARKVQKVLWQLGFDSDTANF